MLQGSDVRYDMPGAAPHPLRGGFAPDLLLAVEGGATRVAELMRRPKGLLLDLAGGQGVADAARAWGDRVEHVRARCEDAPADALLLRPDGHVAWAGGSGLGQALATWFGVS